MAALRSSSPLRSLGRRGSCGISHPHISLSYLDQLFSSSYHDCFYVRAREVFNHEVRKLNNNQVFQRSIALGLVQCIKNNFARLTSPLEYSPDCLFHRRVSSLVTIGESYHAFDLPMRLVHRRHDHETRKEVHSPSNSVSSSVASESSRFRSWLLDSGVLHRPGEATCIAQSKSALYVGDQ